MPPDTNPKKPLGLTLDQLKQAKELQEEYIKRMSPPSPLPPLTSNNNSTYTSQWSNYSVEQQYMTDMGERLRQEVQRETRKIHDLHEFQARLLESKMDHFKERMHELVTALVEQNRELSRRVTELEWEGINP